MLQTCGAMWKPWQDGRMWWDAGVRGLTLPVCRNNNKKITLSFSVHAGRHLNGITQCLDFRPGLGCWNLNFSGEWSEIGAQSAWAREEREKVREGEGKVGEKTSQEPNGCLSRTGVFPPHQTGVWSAAEPGRSLLQVKEVALQLPLTEKIWKFILGDFSSPAEILLQRITELLV